MRTQCGFNLGSARASRAGDGVLAIANFFSDIKNDLNDMANDCGEAPQSAREARALPRLYRTLARAFAASCFTLTICACETANYAPPVTPTITRAGSRSPQNVDLAKLNRGRQLFVHRCIECHTLPPLWKYSREDWPQIVNDMSHRASLNTVQREAVIAYILAVRREM